MTQNSKVVFKHSSAKKYCRANGQAPLCCPCQATSNDKLYIFCLGQTISVVQCRSNIQGWPQGQGWVILLQITNRVSEVKLYLNAYYYHNVNGVFPNSLSQYDRKLLTKNSDSPNIPCPVTPSVTLDKVKMQKIRHKIMTGAYENKVNIRLQSLLLFLLQN